MYRYARAENSMHVMDSSCELPGVKTHCEDPPARTLFLSGMQHRRLVSTPIADETRAPWRSFDLSVDSRTGATCALGAMGTIVRRARGEKPCETSPATVRQSLSPDLVAWNCGKHFFLQFDLAGLRGSPNTF